MSLASRRVIIRIPLNAWAFGGDERLSREWIANRLSIFNRFTLRSLKNQTNQNFTALVAYDKRSEAIINDELEKYDIPDNVVFVSGKEIDPLMDRMVAECEYVLFARIDSDDMYHADVVDELHKKDIREDTEMILNQDGYLYDEGNNQLAYVHFPSPPFYTQVYKSSDFLAGKRFETKSHRDISSFNWELLNSNRNYIVIIHGQNTSTRFKPKSEDDVITDPVKKQEILRSFFGPETAAERDRHIMELVDSAVSRKFSVLAEDGGDEIDGIHKLNQEVSALKEENERLRTALAEFRQNEEEQKTAAVQLRTELNALKKQQDRAKKDTDRRVTKLQEQLSPVVYQQKKLHRISNKPPLKWFKGLLKG
ncbi:hypothetical protein CR205_16020 [Alteribacter lacisalsi]|uniref:Uncharacterized protein n=1 Tax=Alteribacter lacisalsi TaxID=2045244 RepID=A0A2W0H272_9BACI|nr:glycosyltransferase [Alteribacter lacisalsi]PYZ95884.1 hypothetical protein CR205_16020 [Alteribacter lacisalsi]